MILSSPQVGHEAARFEATERFTVSQFRKPGPVGIECGYVVGWAVSWNTNSDARLGE